MTPRTMTATFDYTDLRCPLPVLRPEWTGDVDGDEVLNRTIEPCNSTLGLITTRYQYATVDGIVDGAHDHWKVECEAGHVLFTYDDEGNDYDVPFEHAELLAALAWMSHERCA